MLSSRSAALLCLAVLGPLFVACGGAPNQRQPVSQEEKPQRLADVEACVKVAHDASWGGSLRPIPATVIDKGVMRFVPYASFNAGDYEVNVYGDPERPAGVEVGVRGAGLDSRNAKLDCFARVGRMLLAEADRDTVKMLDLEGGVRRERGLTFEVTPPTAEDAYGGWWVSVYDEAELDRSRANPKEVADLTVAKEDIQAQPPPDPKKTVRATEERPWTRDDLKFARPSVGGTGGLVWVHDYHRKDGTFVRGHWRHSR